MTASFWYISIPLTSLRPLPRGGAHARPDPCCETFVGSCRVALPRLIPIVFRAYSLRQERRHTAHDLVPIRLTSRGEVNKNSNRIFAVQIQPALPGSAGALSATTEVLG